MPNNEPGSPSPFIVVSHPRDPGDFTGTDDIDVEDWLRRFERVSAHNRWDDTLKLANGALCLKQTAEKWFETNEARLTSWDLFKEELRKVFGKPVGRQLAAKQELSTRAQTSTECYVTYIHDVLALCSKVDPDMSETDKVGHILKGIADDAFHLLICKDCATVDSIIHECRRFEQAKGRRIAHQFARLPHTAATSSCADLHLPAPVPRKPDPVAPSADITRIVRREIEAMVPTPTLPYADDHCPPPTIAAIQAVVRDEIASMGLHQVCSIGHPHPSFPQQLWPTTHRSPPAPFGNRRRNPAEWRTPDDRPICFNCSRIGHIARYCRNRWTPTAPNPSPHYGSRSFSYGYTPEAQRRPSPTSDTQHLNADPVPTRFNRSPSPQRRQSRSPQPRRSSPMPDRAARYSSEN